MQRCRSASQISRYAFAGLTTSIAKAPSAERAHGLRLVAVRVSSAIWRRRVGLQIGHVVRRTADEADAVLEERGAAIHAGEQRAVHAHEHAARDVDEHGVAALVPRERSPAVGRHDEPERRRRPKSGAHHGEATVANQRDLERIARGHDEHAIPRAVDDTSVAAIRGGLLAGGEVPGGGAGLGARDEGAPVRGDPRAAPGRGDRLARLRVRRADDHLRALREHAALAVGVQRDGTLALPDELRLGHRPDRLGGPRRTQRARRGELDRGEPGGVRIVRLGARQRCDGREPGQASTYRHVAPIFTGAKPPIRCPSVDAPRPALPVPRRDQSAIRQAARPHRPRQRSSRRRR